ncbi:MAG TPA: Na+/H+ antiporter NhaC family protein, partial [Steroidobacteraceae bacterium]|nr:Na+/H+ antiporter NhaC family protein [Steroidobacteraceae bacterium]
PAGHPASARSDLPHPARGVQPLLAVLVVAFVFHDRLQQSALILALLAGLVTALLVNWRYLRDLGGAVGAGTAGSLLAIGNTSAVVGFGAVARESPAFMQAVDAITHVPGDPLIGAAIAVNVIAGLTGSASGGQAIALPILAPLYLARGVDPEALHRVVAIASGGLDALPHNGYVVTTIRGICGETHRAAYPALAALVVVVPLLGTLLALLLLSA